ncbi:MAG: pilus assembly protein CpaC [Abditibacteriota bacterium]|nr:pilus assembly protein CpaC [Abditibacteriota bacterium]
MNTANLLFADGSQRRGASQPSPSLATSTRPVATISDHPPSAADAMAGANAPAVLPSREPHAHSLPAHPGHHNHRREGRGITGDSGATLLFFYTLFCLSAYGSSSQAAPPQRDQAFPNWLCALPSHAPEKSKSTPLAVLSKDRTGRQQGFFQTHSVPASLTALPIPTPSRAQFQPNFPLGPTINTRGSRTAHPLTQSSGQTANLSPLAPARLKPGRQKFWASSTLGVKKPRIIRGSAPVRLAQALPAAVPGIPVTVQPQVTITETPVSALPPANMAPASLPAALPSTPGTGGELPQGMPAMRKIITVSALKVPPPSATQPLASWMQGATVPADSSFIAPALPAGSRNPLRLAQAAGPTLSQPDRPVTNSDRLPNQIEVAVSTFVVLLTTTDLQTVAVADPSIADVAVVNARAVLVNGKAPGVTSLVVVDRLKIRQYQVRVTEAPGTRPPDIAGQINIPGVNVRRVADTLFLEGEVASAEEARRAEQIAGAFGTKIVNQLTVRDQVGASAGLASQIQTQIGLPNVRVNIINETAFLDGTVENLTDYQRAEQIARALVKNVVNTIRLPNLTVDQVRESIGALSSATSVIPNAGTIGAVAAPLLRQVGDQIILEGTLPSQAEIEQAVTIAQRSGLQIINRLTVPPAPTADVALLTTIERAINRPGVTARGSAKRIVLQGTVPDTNAAVAAEQIARGYAQEVDNLLQTSNPLLVNIDVHIVEISKSSARELGVQVGTVSLLSETVNTPAPIVVPGVAGNNGGQATQPIVIPQPTTRTTTLGTDFAQGLFALGEDVTGSFRNLNPLRMRIGALYSNGNARLLSNPRTTVLSGRTATFQSGGQVPIPGLTTVGQSGTTTGIIFKDFGILLDVVPLANPDGVVTMRVRAEVSAPDFSAGVTPPGGGSPIPGFSRRSTVTEVTVKPNGVLALSGLMQNNVDKTISRIPILSKIPIIGQLFQSKRFQNNETELVIFVQPTVISNILAPGQTAPASPVAAGNTLNTGTVMGNPGIPSFNTGGVFATAGGGAPGGAAGGGGGGGGQ